MSRILYPTVWMGLGASGPAVVARAVASLDGPHPLLVSISASPADLAAKLAAALEPLLRAGRSQGALGEPRLDLVLFADLAEGEEGSLVEAVAALASVIRTDYAVLFPPDRPPEHRSVGLQLVLLAPPLSESPASRSALRRLGLVERWAEGSPPWPLLARVWLVSAQTAAGTLSREEQVASAAAFAVAAFAAGLRDAEALRTRLAHPGPGEGRIGLLSLASLDIPEGPLHRYALERAALDGLSELVARVVRPARNPGRADVRMAKVARSQEVPVFGEFLEVTSAHTEVAKTPPSETLRVVREAAVRLTKPHADPGAAERAVAELDRIEADALAHIHDDIAGRVAAALAPTGGLRGLVETEEGLRSLNPQSDRPMAYRETFSPFALAAEPEPSLPDVVVLPSLAQRRVAAAVFGLSVAYGAAMVGFAALTPAHSAQAAALAAPVVGGATSAATWSLAGALPWGVGLCVGALAAAGFWSRVGRSAREAAASAPPPSAPAASTPWLLTDAVIGIRDDLFVQTIKRKIARGLATLAAARQALIAARDRRQAALVALGVHPSPDAATDDLRPLHGGGGALHGALVPPEVLARWAARCRVVAERDRWADQLLEACSAGEGDVPCADADRVEAAARAQTAPLGTRSVFDDPDVSEAITATVQAFAARIPLALGAAVSARNAAGDPVAGPRSGSVLTVGPVSGRAALARALADAPVSVEALWTPLVTPRLIFLRSWEGLRVAEIARGAGIVGGEP